MNARAAAAPSPVRIDASQTPSPEPLRLVVPPVVLADERPPLRGAAAVRVGLRERFGASSPYWVGEKALHAVESNPRAIRTDRDHVSNAHYQLGLSLAPAYLAFARHIVEHAEAFDRVYFLSREGWMFMRMYHRIAAALGVRASKPRGTYLAVNRRLSFLASMDSFTQSEIARLWAQYPGQSLRRLLKNLCLPEDVFFDLAARHGLTDPDRPIRRPRQHPEFSAFVDDPHVQRAFEIHRDELRGLLTGYLRQRGFFDAGRVALVDIGWKGSIQTNLHRTVRGCAGCPEIHGMYFGLDHKPEMDEPGSTRHGFYCDTRVNDWMGECLLTHNSVFEMFATAPHGTVAGYHRDRRGWVHAEAQVEAEETRNFRGKFRDVWQGINDYTADYLRTPEALRTSAAELRPAVLDRVRRYVLYPTAAEAMAYLSYSHVESFGVFQVSRYHFRGSWKWILGRPYRRVPARLVQTLRAQKWPAGVLKRSRLPFVTWLFDLVETRRRAR